MRADSVEARVQSIDWARVFGRSRRLRLRAVFATADGGRMRRPSPVSTTMTAISAASVVMARHGFGRGEYKYFAYPLPDVDRRPCGPRSTRELAPIANRWNEAMGIEVRYPGRARRLHRALPQGRPDAADAAAAAIRRGRLQLPAPGSLRRACLSAAGGDAALGAGKDFTGGEFVLTEQRPRMQSRAEVRAAAARRRGGVRGASPAGAGNARNLSREPAARRQPAALRPSPYRSA